MKIICIGKNYAAHAVEEHLKDTAHPTFFMKPDTALVINNRPFFYPDFSKQIEYETEIILKICKVGKHIQPEFAHTYYDEIGIGIDFTARDLQHIAIENGLPWEQAKSFDNSGVIGKFVPKDQFSDMHNIDFKLHKNGELVQHGNTKDMIWDFSHLISYISQFVTLRLGDYIFTGSPAGSGSVKIGDELEAFIGEQSLLKCPIR